MTRHVALLTLRSLPAFHDLPDERLAALAKDASLVSVARGEYVIREGEVSDAIYFIVNGRLRVLVSDTEGREVILSLLSAGDLFGEIGLLDDNPRSASVIAVNSSDLVMFSKNTFHQCLADNFDITLSVMRSMAHRIRQANQHIESLSLLDVYGRVARVLLDMAEEKEDGRRIIDQRPTKQDIAKMVGASREMVGRVMKDLQRRGLILELRNREVEIILPG